MYLLSYSKSGVQNFRRFNLSASENLRYIKGIDGHVRPLQTDNCQHNNNNNNNKLPFAREQTVNGLRKIAWASVFRV
jgi:hypothetical protein